jgi:PilZ domain-containing protein
MSEQQATASRNVVTEPRANQRAALRYASCLKTICHIATSQGGFVRDAKVHDLSTDGVGLILEERVEPGTLLSVELENSLKSLFRTVLARVVHVRKQADAWLVGCTFIRGLENGEVDLFSASADGRAWVRTCCALDASVRAGASDNGARWLARVINISLGGIGLLSSRSAEKGQLLHLTLPSAQNGTTLKLIARVVQKGIPVDKEWPLGCEFLQQLTSEEIHTLLL